MNHITRKHKFRIVNKAENKIRDLRKRHLVTKNTNTNDYDIGNGNVEKATKRMNNVEQLSTKPKI